MPRLGRPCGPPGSHARGSRFALGVQAMSVIDFLLLAAGYALGAAALLVTGFALGRAYRDDEDES